MDGFLDDSIKTSLLICQIDFKGSTKNDHTRELKDGIRRIKSHVLRGQYSLLKAKEDASKVACLASLIKRRQLEIDLDEIRDNRNNINKIEDFNLPSNYSILSKLKTISPESYYLWLIAAGVIR